MESRIFKGEIFAKKKKRLVTLDIFNNYGFEVCRRTSKVEGASARTSKLASMQGMEEHRGIRRAMSTPDVWELDTQLTVCMHEEINAQPRGVRRMRPASIEVSVAAPVWAAMCLWQKKE
ncbi:unnamed protein product [Citrullus colocynthis]|uniref:Uncharacterized protein n=1 Tax=Citrullus colocynthis TaxID=252529 RepID=A0ABP0YSA5_9ROSI